WFNDGYTPPFKEFIENAYVSIGIVPIIRHVYLLTLPSVTKETLKRIERAGNLIRYACIIVRLTNDMGTSSDELERGDVPKSVQCYMHETGATEDEAKAYIKQLTLETWKKLNKERQTIDSEFSHEFIDCIMNLARMGHFMYTDGDKHGKPDMFKPYELERLSGNHVAKKTVRLLRHGQKRDLYKMTRLQMMVNDSHLSIREKHTFVSKMNLVTL
nr:(-)-beta-pinene synthase, chloroplastic-like [Tanacetum cinerariifolium]